MNISFYFDPICPFCWITSRWILQVQPHRNLNVIWKPFSLALRNGELNPKDRESSHAEDYRNSHRALRVMVTVQDENDIPLIESYSAIGFEHHVMGEALGDTTIEKMLEKLNLPKELIERKNEEELDKKIQSYVNEATAIVGNDIGVPVIVFEKDDGTKQGYFGPVLNELPELEDSLAIFDGLSKLATAKSFYELKRSRPAGDPDVYSTARC